MKAIFVFAAVWAAVNCAEQYCYKNAKRVCTPTTNKITGESLTNCSAKYGSIDSLQPRLQSFTTSHFQRSFDFLLMSTHYANYEKNREGFEKFFRKNSDALWEDGINLIKYITSRGGEVDLTTLHSEDLDDNEELSDKKRDQEWELYELEAMAKALDIKKELAQKAFHIHKEATRNKESNHDPEVSSHIENTFVHRHRDEIRKLSGYINDLYKLLDTNDASLALYMFDEILAKEVK